MDKTPSWFNYKTGILDRIDDLFSLPDEKIVDYLPQMGGPGLYSIYRSQGLTPLDAYIAVMSAALDKPQEQDHA